MIVSGQVEAVWAAGTAVGSHILRRQRGCTLPVAAEVIVEVDLVRDLRDRPSSRSTS